VSRYHIEYHGRPVDVEIVDDSELLLRLDGVQRKRRSKVGVSCVYVWTNIELEWEEHHFIEARWWPESGKVVVTANGKPLLQAQHDAAD
jgi:hypothetical protein